MFPMLISIGRCIYYIGVATYENKTTILMTYSLFDTTKFAFFVTDKLGIVELIRKKITYVESPQMLLEISGIEETEVGDFEIIDSF
jgi:hypothetical protein